MKIHLFILYLQFQFLRELPKCVPGQRLDYGILYKMGGGFFMAVVGISNRSSEYVITP